MKQARLALALLATAACRQIIGIEDAALDPALAAAGGTTSGALESAGQAPAAAAGAAASSGGGENGGQAGAAAGSAGHAAGAAGAAGATAAALCEQYCELVGQNCRDRFAVYTSEAACRAVCERLPPGSPGDGNVNSVHCRLRAAEAAKDEVAHYCPGAGPGGNGVCGSNCEGLCALRSAACGAFDEEDLSACLTECAELQDLGQYSTSTEAQQYSGSHVQCRLYHVSAAPLADTEKHCSHAAGMAPCN